MKPDLDLPVMSSSEETALKNCPLAHHFAYDLRYKPIVTGQKLSVGIGYHEGLEAYYRGGSLDDMLAAVDAWAEERWQEFVSAGIDDQTAARLQWSVDRDLVRAMVTGYPDWVTEEGLDDGYRVEAVEESWYIEVPGADTILPVKLDLLLRNERTGKLLVVDHKTRAQFYSDLTSYQLAEQNGNYQLAVFAQYDERPDALAYREARKIVPSGRTKPPYYREVRVLLTPEEMLYRVEEYQKMAALKANPDRPIYANPGSCCGSWKAEWKAACLLVHQGYSPEEAVKLAGKYEQRDPYERYDESELNEA